MPRLGKRAVLAAALAGFTLALPPRADAGVDARQADTFVDSIGVNVHLAFDDTPYVSAFPTVARRLEELGVRHIRDELYPDRADQYQRLNALAAAGIGSTLIVGSPANGVAGLETLLGVAGDDIDGVDALEGPNEYSTSGDPEWQPHLVAYQQALYEQAKGDPALSSLPVIGPSIVHGDQDELGDISPSLDLGNIHSYPQGNPPDKLGSAIARAELNSAQKPIAATETGYHTALNWSGEHPPVSEAAMATYMPRLYLEYFRWGVARTFSYELLDEWPDPGLDERESDFGLLRNDLEPKPAFEALRNTIAILEDPGTPFAPAALDYALSEDGVEISGPESPRLHKALLQKRDGSYYLALWRTASVWDPATGEPLAAPSEPLEVTVEPGIESATAYLPNVSAAPVWSLTQPDDPITVGVGPAVTVLRLVPGTSGSEPEAGLEPEPAPEPNTGPGPGAGPGPSDDQDTDDGPRPSPPCSVPKLSGRNLKSARAKLRAAHCRLGTVAGPRERSSRVASQHPRAGQLLDPASAIDVRLSPNA
jgi:hypothetical protein